MKNLHWYIVVVLMVGSFLFHYIRDIEQKNKMIESIRTDVLQTMDENKGVVEEVLTNIDNDIAEKTKLKDSLQTIKIESEKNVEVLKKTKTELKQIKDRKQEVILDTVFVKDSVFYSKENFYELFDK
jgi:hypothetical protein